MKRILGFVVPFLLSLPLLAAEEERGAASAPVATVDVVYVAIFLILFFGTIGGFLVYFFVRDDKENSGKQP